MQVALTYRGKNYTTNLSQPQDISIALAPGSGHVLAWYVTPMVIEPVRMGDWVGEVKSGASVNFRNIHFNPHAHGTHTETLGHISADEVSVNRHFHEYFCFADLISIAPSEIAGDRVLELTKIRELCPHPADAVILRTLPNERGKLTRNYSHTNPPYLEAAAAHWLREQGVRHLLIDLPSVDKEEDGGKLAAHHAFWDFPEHPRLDATISEFVFVPDVIEDGRYFMNLQVAPFDNDAAPSRPLLFILSPEK